MELIEWHNIIDVSYVYFKLILNLNRPPVSTHNLEKEIVEENFLILKSHHL